MIVCALYTCDFPRYAERRRLCEETWGRDVRPPFEFAVHGGGWRYEELPAKTKAMCRWAREKGCDGLYKIDDDTFVRAGKLTVPDFDYGGSILDGGRHDRKFEYCTGGFYWLSRRAVEIVADADLTDDIAEDRWVGATLRAKGIAPVEMPVALQPCQCGRCTRSTPQDGDWTAYVMGLRYTPEGFRRLGG